VLGWVLGPVPEPALGQGQALGLAPVSELVLGQALERGLVPEQELVLHRQEVKAPVSRHPEH
jgi:hypothetical protein